MNRLGRPISFTLEPDVVSLFANISFGAAGAPTLNQGPYPKIFSKGFCNISRNAISFTATLDGSTAVLTAVSSFAGLYVGMIVTGVGIPAASTIVSMNAGAATLTISANTTAASTEVVSAAGGQYILQLGTQAGVRLDTYNHLLGLSPEWDEVANQGGASTLASAPSANVLFLIGNQTSVRTIPSTAASSLTDATITFQCGYYNGSDAFVAKDPDSGSVLRLAMQLGRSSAI
jgi:hypothetical protein